MARRRPSFRSLVALSALLYLSGCAFNEKPFIAYENINHPHSDTAILSSAVRGNGLIAQITQVNGRATTCWQVGCPIWVRVLPGRNTFRIRYQTGSLVGEGELTIENMKARHVYWVNYEVYKAESKFSMGYDDLGENANFRVYLGLPGVNQKEHKATF